MEKSESLKELATALAKAQGKIKGALKDADNPFFKSKYADLASVVEAIREAFSSNSLSYVQIVHSSEKNEVAIETILMHSSGEWLSCGILRLPVTKADAQGFGSALTYARRYSLSAAAGVAPEDDDGNAAAKAAPPKASMPEGNIADHLAAIEGSATLPELQKTYTAAYKAAQAATDVPAMETITKAKNARKAALSERELA